MKNFKLWCRWIFYGLYPHCTFEQYKFVKNFVGPPRESLYQEMSGELDRMIEESKSRSEASSLRTAKILRDLDRMQNG